MIAWYQIGLFSAEKSIFRGLRPQFFSSYHYFFEAGGRRSQESLNFGVGSKTYVNIED